MAREGDRGVPASRTLVGEGLVAGSSGGVVRAHYTAGAGATTTWRARVEGNPVHLTQ